MGREVLLHRLIMPRSINMYCRIGCNGCPAFLKPWLFFLWLSQFPNGMIQNKISITMSLVAWRGYTGEDSNKGCVTNESKWKDPMDKKSYWSVIKQVLLNSLCFSQLKATWHISHHKIIYSMDFGWSVFMQNLNFEVPHRKMLYKPTQMEGLCLSWWYPFAPCTRAYIYIYIYFFYKA